MSFKCKICGKENPEHVFRCEEHYRCDVCGTKEDLCYRDRGLTCDKCHKEIAEKQIVAFEGVSTEYENEITCPWCGHIRSDSWEASDEDEHECGNCGNEYSHIREVEVTYSTYKIEADGD